MKKGKSASTNRGRNFNILLTVVALVLIVAVGGFVTYSWVEQATTLDVEMNGDIQRVPGGNTEYYQQVELKKGTNSAISLKDYVDKASDMMLSPVSSADGKNFFMKKGTIYANSSPSDRNVSYITFDFDVTSDTKTNIYFDDGNNSKGTEDTTGNYFKPSFKFGDAGAELESIRVAIQVNDETPLIFSRTSKTYEAISSTSGGRTEVTTKAFEEYEFGGTPIFEIPQSTLEKKINTKVRITIWLEGTDSNLSEEYKAVSPLTLNMKLMLTTPWNKATAVQLVDKTANSMFSESDNFYLVDGENEIKMTKNTDVSGNKFWSVNIAGSKEDLIFKYKDGTTEYIWNASGRGDNFVYNIFDYGTTNGYGVWSLTPIVTEAINIKDCIVGTSLTTGTNGELDSHIKVSTDGTNYYRAAYNSTESKWTVNIDTSYSNLYVQYYSNGSNPTAKWDAKSTRTDKTKTTYYLLDTEGGTTSDSLGSWVNEYNVYFYDGTAEQITTKTDTTIAYKAYSGDVLISSGNVETDSTAEYRFVADKQLNYTDKINKVVFTLSRPTANGGNEEVTYTWNGNKKVNKDIYYTAQSYTKD